MTSMVEKVARALFRREGRIYDDEERLFEPFPFEELDEIETACLMDAARAAIQAMREPTQEMKSANEDVESAWGYSCHICGGPKQTYDAMIDAALKEE